MTVGGDFIGDYNEVEEPQYPVVFGISMTPVVIGVLAALAGAAAAAYLFFNVVQPELDRKAQLEADVAAKEQQLRDQGEVQRQIEEARIQLAEARKLKADVLELFASEESLDTLLLDLNERVQSANAQIANPERRANLSKFDMEPPPAPAADGLPGDVINDGSFGNAVNGQLRRRVYNVTMQGSFAQIQSIVRNIERLQPLLVVDNFKTELARPEPLVFTAEGRPVFAIPPEPRLNTSFKLTALIPAELPAPVAAPAEGAPPVEGAPPADGAAPSPAP